MKQIAALGVVLLATACGGEADNSGGTGGAGVGGSAGTPGTGAQPGTGGAPATGSFAWPAEKPSFTLTTTKKEQTLTGPGFATTRLDLRQSAGAFEAALGSEVACSVTVGAAAVSLSGCGKANSVTVEELVLPRAADGALTGSFQARSRYSGLFQGDMLVNEVTEFSGTIAFDAQPPGLDMYAQGVLPWHKVNVLVSEGVDPTQLAAAVSLSVASGAPPSLAWKAEPGAPAWTGARALVGTFTDWASLAGGSSFDLAMGPVNDLNGNASLAMKANVKVVALGKLLVVHDFEAGSSLATSGNAAHQDGTTAGICEAGACVSLGPGDKCQAPVGDVRGLLEVNGKTKVRLRTRVIADSATAVPEFELRLYAPSGETSTTAVGHFDGSATAAALTLGYGATFGDDVVPLPAAGSVVGFQLALKSGPGNYFCNPGPTVALVLEKIGAE
ncbi:MAG: hypothetical protein DYH12_26845 [Sorangiineae bacterium PRO1]|nr:hypothetical protein [Sorangiineae bacterium PRO1]